MHKVTGYSDQRQDDSLLLPARSPCFPAFLCDQEANTTGLHPPGPSPSDFQVGSANIRHGQQERKGGFVRPPSLRGAIILAVTALFYLSHSSYPTTLIFKKHLDFPRFY